MIGQRMMMAAAGLVGRTSSPSITHLSGGIASTIAANTAVTKTVSVTAGTMLLVALAQESTTASSNPAITSVTATGLTFTRLGSIIGPGNGGLADAQSLEIWGAAITATNSALSVSWEYNTAIDDATYSFEQVSNYGAVSFADTYTAIDTQSITFSAPDFSLAVGFAGCPYSTAPGALTGFAFLASQDNAGATYWEYSTTSALTVGASAITNSSVSQAATASDYPLIMVGIILGT